jgi:hypothetical protein
MMADWVWVLPSEAVVDGTVAGRKIIKVTDKKKMCAEAFCRKTQRLMWPGYYQLVRIQ